MPTWLKPALVLLVVLAVYDLFLKEQITKVIK
jgi:hypothetical protein